MGNVTVTLLINIQGRATVALLIHIQRSLTECGMWFKGKAVTSEFRGVNSEPSYAELSRQTGRDDHSLKRWHDLYKKWPDVHRNESSTGNEENGRVGAGSSTGRKWKETRQKGSRTSGTFEYSLISAFPNSASWQSSGDKAGGRIEDGRVETG